MLWSGPARKVGVEIEFVFGAIATDHVFMRGSAASSAGASVSNTCSLSRGS